MKDKDIFAFPENSDITKYEERGMTLRDYFAGHALTNLRINHPAYDFDILAKHAYKYADAMLIERNK